MGAMAEDCSVENDGYPTELEHEDIMQACCVMEERSGGGYSPETCAILRTDARLRAQVATLEARLSDALDHVAEVGP